RRRHTRSDRDWSSDVCSSDLSNPRGAAFEDQLRDQQIVAGTPRTVIPKLRRLLEETRPSILGFWASDGFVKNEDARTCIRLLGQIGRASCRERVDMEGGVRSM